MAYTTDDPRYGFTFKTTFSGDSSTKTINNVNLKVGGASSGYDVDQVGIFIEAVAESIIGAAYDSASITAQYPVINEP